MTDRTTFSVVFFCKKTKLNKKGKAPIYVRITTSGVSTEIYTQCQIEPEKWNQKAERSLARDSVSLQINEIIGSFRANILAAYDLLVKENKQPNCFPLKSACAVRSAIPACSSRSSPNIATSVKKRSECVSRNLQPTNTTVCCAI